MRPGIACRGLWLRRLLTRGALVGLSFGVFGCASEERASCRAASASGMEQVLGPSQGPEVARQRALDGWRIEPDSSLEFGEWIVVPTAGAYGQSPGACRIFTLDAPLREDEAIVEAFHLAIFHRAVLLDTGMRLGVAFTETSRPQHISRVLWLGDALDHRLRDFEPGGRVEAFLRGGPSVVGVGEGYPSAVGCAGISLEAADFRGVSAERRVAGLVERLCDTDCPLVEDGGRRVVRDLHGSSARFSFECGGGTRSVPYEGRLGAAAPQSVRRALPRGASGFGVMSGRGELTGLASILTPRDSRVVWWIDGDCGGCAARSDGRPLRGASFTERGSLCVARVPPRVGVRSIRVTGAVDRLWGCGIGDAELPFEDVGILRAGAAPLCTGPAVLGARAFPATRHRPYSFSFSQDGSRCVSSPWWRLVDEEVWDTSSRPGATLVVAHQRADPWLVAFVVGLLLLSGFVLTLRVPEGDALGAWVSVQRPGAHREAPRDEWVFLSFDSMDPVVPIGARPTPLWRWPSRWMVVRGDATLLVGEPGVGGRLERRRILPREAGVSVVAGHHVLVLGTGQEDVARIQARAVQLRTLQADGHPASVRWRWARSVVLAGVTTACALAVPFRLADWDVAFGSRSVFSVSAVAACLVLAGVIRATRAWWVSRAGGGLRATSSPPPRGGRVHSHECESDEPERVEHE